MASTKPLQPLSKHLIQTSRTLSNRKAYICAPCLHNQQQRKLSSATQSTKAPPQIPQPTPFVPDVATFLTLIGRGLSAHTSKITSWSTLFTSSSEQLKTMGIEPARTRRYLLRWRDKFRRGIYGPGGDFRHVKDGIAHLRVIEVPVLEENKAKNEGHVSTSSIPGMTRLVLNVPEGTATWKEVVGSEGNATQQRPENLKKPSGFKLVNGRYISGPYAVPVKGMQGEGAVVKVVEGMWEDRLGKKVFGGERRRKEVLHKLGVAEHRKEMGTVR